jgi:hypothetical protein
MRPVVALADKANGCSTRNVELLRVNPDPELFAYDHSQEAEQRHDGRCRTLHSDQAVQNPNTQTNYKGYEQDSHRISPDQIRLENSKNWGQRDVYRVRIDYIRVRTRALWAE